jgi:ankyrin repeat protein
LASRSHLEIVKGLIKNGAGDSVNVKDLYGSTPLNFASIWGHLEIVNYLKKVIEQQ